MTDPHSDVPTPRAAPRRLSRVTTAFLGVAILHLFVLLFLHTLSVELGRDGFSFVTIGGDDGYFHYSIARTMVSTDNLSPESFGVFLTAWPSVMAYFMQAIGSTDILATKTLLFVPNIVMLAASLALFDRLNENAPNGRSSPSQKVRLLIGIGIYPSLLSFSYGSLYRDAWIYCLFVVSTLVVVAALGKTPGSLRLGAVVFLPFLLFALYRFRDYAAAAVVVGSLAWLVGLFFGAITSAMDVSRATRRLTLWTLYGIVAVILAILFWGSPLAQAVSAYRNGFSVYAGGGNLGIQMDLTNPLQTILVLPYSFVSNVLGPLPWQVTSAASVLSFLIEVPALVLVTRGLVRCRKALSRADWLVLTISLGYFFVIALANDNVGTATRLRVAGWLPIFVVYARVSKEGKPRSAAQLAV